MNNSVVETGYLGHSPARSIRNVKSRDLFTWIARGLDDMKLSPVSSLAWGVGFTISLYGIYLLLTSSLAASFAYTAPLTTLALFFAGGMIASSRQIEISGSADTSAAVSQLWRAKLNLVMIGLALSILVLGWMGLSLVIGVVSAGMETASVGSMYEMVMSVKGVGSLAALSILTTVMIITAFALAFVSIPMVVDGDQDFLNAMLTSAASFRKNFRASIIAAVALVGLLVVSALLWFPLTLVAAPIASHAAWHGYRSLVD